VAAQGAREASERRAAAAVTLVLKEGAADLLGQLSTLCPEAGFSLADDGSVTAIVGGCEAASGGPNSAACQCVCRLITSKNTWNVHGGPEELPYTAPADDQGDTQPGGGKGKGCGGEIHAPTTDSPWDYGAYDTNGNKLYVPKPIVLGHELCGHAAHMDAGDHVPGPQPKGNRPTHDQAIDEENKIRGQQGVDPRGKFADPNHGESFRGRWV